jgi:hypothetical protein
MQELVGKMIRYVILGALVYYIVFDNTQNEKDLTVSIEKAVEISTDVTHVHNEKGELTELGFTTLPRLVFDKSKIYPVIFGMNMFRNLKMKEFDHFGFQYKNYFMQMAYV